MTTPAPPRVLSVLEALTKPLLTDRTLPPIAGTPPDAFEALYARRPDPWGVLTSPVAQQRQLALIEVVSQYAPCHSILDVGCGEGALTRYLISYTHRERERLEPHIDAYGTAAVRSYHSFFGLKRFGFTIIRLMPSARSTM